MLFGTDGIRGGAAMFLEGGLALDVGRAIASAKDCPKIIIATDTRVSSPFIERQFSIGAASAGGKVYRAGMLPTPALAYLTKHYGADYGVMISASHNPPVYNGIKVFDEDGGKLSLAEEARLEELIVGGAYNKGIGGVYNLADAKEDYIAYVERVTDFCFEGAKVTLDACHGATARIAAQIFKRMGAKVTSLCDNPDGELINVYSGSTNINYLEGNLTTEIGFAFDGDGDRVTGVLREDNILLDGDHFLYHLTKYMEEKGLLKNRVVVGTKMTNTALIEDFTAHGIAFIAADVGDKYVLEKMKEHNASLGGEQAGHIIIKNDISTGDGIIAAALLLKLYKIKGAEAFKEFRPYPQILVNVKADGRLLQSEEVAAEIKECEQLLANAGRILVRPSGTEPLIRVMVECKNRAVAKAVADKICGIFHHIR